MLWLGGVVSMAAQAGPAWSHQAWTTEEGLPDATVHQVLQTRDGYIWVATEGGAARFDGTEFTVYRHETQPAFLSNDVSSLAQDSSGDLWLGTAEGLIRAHGGSFQHFGLKDGLPSDRVLSLTAAANGTVLVLTGDGLVAWHGNGFSRVPLGDRTVTALGSDATGAVRLLTDGGQVLQYGAVLTEVRAPQANEPQHALGLAVGPNGSTWIFNAHEVAVEGPGLRHTLKIGKDLPGSRVNTVYVARDRTLWIGTNHGLFTLSPGQPGKVRPVESLESDAILNVFEDREGNFWIGTESSGLHILRPRKFRIEPASAGEAATAVVALGDDLAWFGTRDSGVHRIRHGVLDQPVRADALTSPVILSLAAGTHDDLWAGTPDGLNHLSSAAVARFTSANGLPDDFVRSVLVDAHGVVWAGTRAGLARIEGSLVTTRTRADGLASDSIGPLAQGRSLRGSKAASGDDLWIGTSGGLSHLAAGRIDSFTPNADGTSDIVTALAPVADAELLVAVHGSGLFLFQAGKFLPVGLPAVTEDVASLLIDTTGYVWIRESHGLYRASLADLRACAQRPAPCSARVDRFTIADGLPNEASAAEGSPQLALAASGTLWIATRKGLALADSAQLPVNTVPPPVVIQRFAVDGADLPIDPNGMTIGSGHGRYTFSFAALSYTLPARIRYRYKLEGLDRDWIDSGTSRTAYYTSLPARRYRFEVQAQNNDGVWDRQDAVVAFRILPPFYRRWWFALLVLLFAAGMVLLLIRLRERVVQRRFALVLQERNRMAREIHDTLAQDFVSVSLQLDIAASMLRNQQTDQALTQLGHTRGLVKEGLQAARQSIWNLRASTGEDSLPARLSALVPRYSFGGRSPNLSIGGAFRKLSDALEAEVLRIAQESLSNAERHSGASEVRVALSYKTDQLQLTVRDNGKGFSLEEAQRIEGHYGLRGIRERAATLGAELMITSNPGEGTTVSLVVPLRKES